MKYQKKVPINPIKVNPKKTTAIENQLTSLIAKDNELKYLAQKSFVSYIRSVHLNSNKEVFKLNELPLDAFAKSLGLLGTPRIRFTKTLRFDKNTPIELLPPDLPLSTVKSKTNHDDDDDNQNKTRNDDDGDDGRGDDEEEDEDESSSDIGSGDEEDVIVKKKEKDRCKQTRVRTRVNQGPLSLHRKKLIHDEDEDDDGDDPFLSIKRTHRHDEEDESHDGDRNDDNANKEKEERKPLIISKTKRKKLLSRVVAVPGSDGPKRTVFDDEGEVCVVTIVIMINTDYGGDQIIIIISIIILI